MATGTVGNTAFTQTSPLDDPAFAQLFQQILGSIPSNLPGIDQLVAQGMSSPILQAILGPALERLKLPQAQQRQQFTESARSAGGLRGSTYSSGMTDLMKNQGQQQNDLMSQVIQQVLSTLVSGQLQSQQQQFLPTQAMSNLLPRIAPQTVQGSMAGMGGGGGGGAPAGRSSILQPGQDYGNYAAGNAITQPGVGAAFGTPSPNFGAPAQQQQAQQPIPQYADPWSWVPQTGAPSGNFSATPLQYNYGGGWTGQDLNQNFNDFGLPADAFGFTQQDWAADPYFSEF